MWLFKQKQETKASDQEPGVAGSPEVRFDPSILRQNNITRLSIDERWTKLFVSIRMNPEIERAEKEMNELIKKEAMLRNEQDNLEPKKRKCMSEIMNLTKEAFEKNNHDAKVRLKECKREIEQINTRINNVLGDIEKVEEELKTANFKLLEDSAAYIFTTLKTNITRAGDIKSELEALEQKEKALREELETISTDWTQYAVDLTDLIGTDEVKRLEAEFGLEGFANEAADTKADEGD
jgi:chromosome segregation ATPase